MVYYKTPVSEDLLLTIVSVDPLCNSKIYSKV